MKNKSETDTRASDMRLTLINASTSFMIGYFGAIRTDQKALAVCAEYLVSCELKSVY